MLEEIEVLPMKIKLEVVLDAIETADDAFTYFYDTQTNDVIVLSDLDSYEEREAIAGAWSTNWNILSERFAVRTCVPCDCKNSLQRHFCQMQDAYHVGSFNYMVIVWIDKCNGVSLCCAGISHY